MLSQMHAGVLDSLPRGMQALPKGSKRSWMPSLKALDAFPWMPAMEALRGPLIFPSAALGGLGCSHKRL